MLLALVPEALHSPQRFLTPNGLLQNASGAVASGFTDHLSAEVETSRVTESRTTHYRNYNEGLSTSHRRISKQNFSQGIESWQSNNIIINAYPQRIVRAVLKISHFERLLSRKCFS